MWGPGVKRKLEQDQDGEEEEGGEPPPGVPGFSSQASYVLQRQMVLNMSLVKLYRPPSGRADLGLQRRILISNVIRRIHDDLRREGGVRALFLAVPPPPGIAEREEEKDGCYLGPPPPPPASQASSFRPSGLESGLTPASLLEEYPPPFFTLPPSPSFSSSPSPHQLLPQSLPQHLHPSTPPSPPPKDSFSSALEEIEELDSSSSSSSSSSDSAANPPLALLPASSPPGDPLPGVQGPGWDRDMEVEAERRVHMEEEEEEEEEEARELVEYRPTSPPRGPAPPRRPVVPSGGFLTDFAMDDVLFTDIDTSMYDLGPCGPQAAGAGPGTGAGPAKVAADDLVVRTISGYGGGGAGGHQGQPFRMDLAELDHIMEVLVGS